MEPSSNQGLNGLQQNHNDNSFNGYLNGIHTYASNGDANNNTNYSEFTWDPELFAEGTSTGPAYPQQNHLTQATYTQPISRQSNNSPALPQYQPAQPSYPPQGSYQQPYFDTRNASQPTFDERFLPRTSASPGPFDQYQNFQQQPLNYSPQSFNQIPQYQPRQNLANIPQYSQRQPQSSLQYMNLAARPPTQLSHVQNADNATTGYHPYSNIHHNTHSFVNPSLLSANGLSNMNGGAGNQSQQPRHMHSAPYHPKPSATVDPQLLQPMQGPSQQPVSIETQDPRQIQPHQFLPQGQNINQAPNAKVLNGSNGIKPPKSKAPKAKKAVKGASDSDSANELEVEDEPPEMTPAILVVSAPSDARGKALHSAVEAVWSPRNKPVTPEKIRSGIHQFGETVRKLRDLWKARNDALIKAELPNSDTAKDIPKLKDEVAHFRQVMETVMSRSLDYGHDSIVKRLGENHIALSALSSFLLDRNRVGDYDSTLVNSIFQFAAKFTTMDEEMLETVKWTKLLQRFSKKTTTNTQQLAKQILDNAKAQTTRRKAAKAEEDAASPGSSAGDRSSLLKGGIKRTRDGDSLGPPAKKAVKPASKPLALQSAERRKAIEKESALKAAEKTGRPSATTTARQKVAMTAPLKNNAFAGLLSASKKPGTSMAEKAAMAVKEKTIPIAISTPNEGVPSFRKEEVKKESPPRSLGPAPTAKTGSSFLGFLADMDKPKESEVKKTIVVPNETEEQRGKRLRKEARRKLRVTWKTDSELVETRVFTLDPDEKTGHADSMMRDAGDVGKEGEMLKLHKGVDDVDDEDEDDVVNDLGEYKPPTEVDASEMEVVDVGRTGTFTKVNGLCKPESESILAQDKYEENTLMAIYVFKSDRPDTPKELPSVNDDEDFSPCIDFGKPEEKTLRREEAMMSLRPQFTQTPSTTGYDLAAQLRAAAQQPQTQQQPAMFNTDLQRTLSMLSQHNQQPALTPAVQNGGLDIARLMAVVQQAKQAQQVQPAPQYTPSAAPAPTTSMAIPANLAALVAQVTGGQQALPNGNSGNPNPYPGATNPVRKHGRSEDLDAQGNRKKSKVPVDAEGKPLNYRTQVCSYWLDGKCTRGDNCNYRHDEGVN